MGGKLGDIFLAPGVIIPFACLDLYAERLIFFFGAWFAVFKPCDFGCSASSSSSSPGCNVKQSW